MGEMGGCDSRVWRRLVDVDARATCEPDEWAGSEVDAVGKDVAALDDAVRGRTCLDDLVRFFGGGRGGFSA